MLKVTWQDEKVFSLLVDYRPHIIYNPKWKILSHFAFLKLVDTPPFGFHYFKKSNMFVVLYSLRRFSLQPLAFFYMIKPRRKEFLLSQWIILSDPDFNNFYCFRILKQFLNSHIYPKLLLFFNSKGDGLQNLAKCPTEQSHSLYFLFTQSASVWVVRFDMVFSGTLVVNFQFWGSQKRFLILSLIDQFPIRYLGIGRYIQQMNTLQVLPLSTWILFL